MSDHLSIRSDLDHDGDGLVRFRVSVENREFRATTVVCGDHEESR